jgi:hypothetical protein
MPDWFVKITGAIKSNRIPDVTGIAIAYRKAVEQTLSRTPNQQKRQVTEQESSAVITHLLTAARDPTHFVK